MNAVQNWQHPGIFFDNLRSK